MGKNIARPIWKPHRAHKRAARALRIRTRKRTENSPIQRLAVKQILKQKRPGWATHETAQPRTKDIKRERGNGWGNKRQIQDGEATQLRKSGKTLSKHNKNEISAKLSAIYHIAICALIAIKTESWYAHTSHRQIYTVWIDRESQSIHRRA